ncbi:Fe-S cluster assembly protein SufD [Kaistia hirudinis]|uniref:Fe-S cluster assembly protein SufD n=1 Tax=Kaistia hirudinis TaxID=1293440 RepID=A0A840AJA6_9HYPH|nr:Fe-S cluster assembly protein SufD [Kaistia hirudinis]MBB3929107.1 Fe-S cluster assembly protein SufD [Kaistia hirudinis]
MNAEPRILRTQAEDTFAAEYQAARARLPGGPGMAAARDAAFAAFQAAGLPHRRVETWRYTDLRALVRAVPPLAGEAPSDGAEFADPLPGLDRARLVIVDGVYRPELSDLSGLDGVAVQPMAALMEADDPRIGTAFARIDDPMVSLNAALMSGGVAIDVPAGVAIARAIEIAHVTTSAVGAYVRNAVRVGEGASVRIIESHVGRAGSAYQANIVTEASVADRAKVVWAKLQAEGDAALHIGSLAVTIGREANFDHLVLMTGAAIARAQSFVTFAGEQARAGLFGATMIGGKQHADILLSVDHAVPNGSSRERFKAVMDGRADGIFQGRIIVRPGAQKTDARMMTQGLLLSEEATFAAKPELEIFADDVQCAHGATSGEVDEDLLFYLISRGIPKAEAETLLVTAFLAEAIEGLGDEAIGEAFEKVAVDWLARRGNSANGTV